MNSTIQNRTYFSEVTILHVIGVIIIFSCHVFQVTGPRLVGETLMAGIPLFLFVSGFLAGFKEVPFNQLWMKRKAKRILLPYYVMLIVVFVAYVSWGGQFIPKQWIVLFVNLQGLTNFLFFNDQIGYWSPLNIGLGHFWFVTIILLCYLLVPVVNACYKQLPWLQRNVWKFLLLLLFVAEPILVYYNITIGNILIFFIGFFFAKKKIVITPKLFTWSMIAMCLFVSLRVLSRNYLDDTILYNHYISGLASKAIGIGIVMMVFQIRDWCPVFVDKIAKWKVIVWLDSIIYEVFLVHHIFIKGSWSVFNFVNSTVEAVGFMLVISLAGSYLLHKISLSIEKKI